MKETNHDYQGALMGNAHDSRYNAEFSSWAEFKAEHAGFIGDEYDDTYNFVFRYDIDKAEDNTYTLELCIMLQRKGIYTNLEIRNITQEVLDTEVVSWLKARGEYIKSLWGEVL